MSAAGDGPGPGHAGSSHGQSGQAALLMLGVLAALLTGVLVLFGFGQALGARSHAQRAADLAAVSAAQVMRRHFSRLFEPALLGPGVPNPRHLSNDTYLALARAAALRGAQRNGARPARVGVRFPEDAFAPTRVTVSVRGDTAIRVPGGRRRDRIEVRARATAELSPDAGGAFGMPTHGSGGGYAGPLAYRMGKPTCRFPQRGIPAVGAGCRSPRCPSPGDTGASPSL